MGSGVKAAEFTARFEKRRAEINELCAVLYPNDWSEELIDRLYAVYRSRSKELKERDRERENDPLWYRGSDILGMMMYTDAFAGNLKGVAEKMDYLRSSGINYLHLMPLLDSPKGKDDGGYAVADFRKVRPDLGTVQDLVELTSLCHREGINCCLDFVMNHTSEEHKWARAARSGDKEAQNRYFFYEDRVIPDQLEQTMPEVFPTTAPGSFTYLPECGKYVMTTFYPYQWDLNYSNFVVLVDMIDNMMFLANCGIDVIRLDAVPYIWKELGTNCRNLPQVHQLLRLIRLCCEIVCPGVLLLGEVVMEPVKVVPYYGTVEKPECHMLYNVTTMASTWNTVATGDVGLLRRQMDQVCALPKEYVFLNYLRCHDDIGWGLDYDWLRQFGMEQVPHKKYLNDMLTGKWEGSVFRGELYNDDPRIGDARLCGTTASLVGLETALVSGDPDRISRAADFDLMLHAYLFVQSGIPVLYSGDEVGQLNDYTYKNDPLKAADSRYLHRGAFKWEKLDPSDRDYPVTKRIYDTIRQMEILRAENPVFHGNADVWTFDTGYRQVLGIGRYLDGVELRSYFNFSGNDLDEVWMPMDNGREYTELMTGLTMEQIGNRVPAYGFRWFRRQF